MTSRKNRNSNLRKITRKTTKGTTVKYLRKTHRGALCSSCSAPSTRSGKFRGQLCHACRKYAITLKVRETSNASLRSHISGLKIRGNAE